MIIITDIDGFLCSKNFAQKPRIIYTGGNEVFTTAVPTVVPTN